MKLIFEELDSQTTPLGEISLRRRSEPRLNGQILYEVKLNDEFLMSSLFTEAEIQLAKLGIAALERNGYRRDLDIVVGGLGLGYTALAALDHPSVKSLKVVEVMEAVIDWHRRGLVPLGESLSSDTRCEFIQADFFALANANTDGFDPSDTTRRVHAILLDIDHSPSHWLNSGNRLFYTIDGLQNAANKLHSGGVFGLWSNDLPDNEFTRLLDTVFRSSESHVVTFPNPYTGGESTNSVYLAFK